MDEKLLQSAVDAALKAGATYADARWVGRRLQVVSVKNGGVYRLGAAETAGVGVRVIADGAWGFAATFDTGEKALRSVAEEAVALAKAAARFITRPVELAPVEPAVDDVGHWAEVNPFEVPLQDKIDLLMQCDAAMAAVPDIAVRQGVLRFERMEKLLVTSEGACIRQDRIVSGAMLQATAAATGEVQRRSYPSSHGGQTQARGWELIEELALPEHAPEIAREAAELLKADECPEGEFDIILDGSQVALQVHESCGHPIELDRVLGSEASFAGTSFLTLDQLGKLQYGSEIVNIVADATIPGALGSFAYDDEGVPAQRVDIVREGLFVGYLTSRETAPVIGQTSNGTMRADGWERMPLIRMTNINLLPGDAGSLDDLIRDTDDGLLFCTNRSWSIDDRRLNFQFACEIAYRIKGGEITGILRNPQYQGITPEFWRSCDAICGEQEWQVWGVPNCGKGEPMQTMQVGHGVAPARFRGVKVAAAK